MKSNRGDTDIENRFVDTVGEGKGKMDRDISFEIYTLPYGKQIASGNLVYNAGNSNLVLCDYQKE